MAELDVNVQKFHFKVDCLTDFNVCLTLSGIIICQELRIVYIKGIIHVID